MSTGAIHVLYSPHSSLHGALLPLQKMPRTAPRDPSYSTADLKPVIYTPDALPMFADQGHRMSLHQKEKKAKMMRPTEPMTGAGRGGRLGASATQSLVQTLFTQEMLNEDVSLGLLVAVWFGRLVTDDVAARSVAQVRRQEGRRGEVGISRVLGWNNENGKCDYTLLNYTSVLKAYPYTTCSLYLNCVVPML